MKKTEKKRNNIINNIIFIGIFIILLIAIIVVSLNIKKEDKTFNTSFSSSEFKNITAIGLYEYEASFAYEGNSVIFFCNNEKRECFDELTDLDEIASKYGISIEYIDILELLEDEKKQLREISNIFNDDFYPNLVLIKDGEVVNNSNKYLNEEDIVDLLSDKEFIE